MERKISYQLYALALVVTVMVFCIGIYVGDLIDQYNQQAISDQVENISAEVASTQLLLLLDGNSSSFCPVYSSQLDSINSQVETIGYKLSYLEDEKHVYDTPLKMNYFVLEAQSYLLSKRIQERCGENSTILIYFYSNTNCSGCLEQGNDILTARDQTVGKVPLVRIYSFDGDLGSPIADSLKAQFNVTQYPSILINGELHSGAMSEGDIVQALGG